MCVCACQSWVQTRVCLIGEQLAWQAALDEGIMGWRLCLSLSPPHGDDCKRTLGFEPARRATPIPAAPHHCSHQQQNPTCQSASENHPYATQQYTANAWFYMSWTLFIEKKMCITVRFTPKIQFRHLFRWIIPSPYFENDKTIICELTFTFTHIRVNHAVHKTLIAWHIANR